MLSKSEKCPRLEANVCCKCSKNRIFKVDKWLINKQMSQTPICEQFRRAYFDDDQIALQDLFTVFKYGRCICCGYTLLHLAVHVASKDLLSLYLSRNMNVEAKTDNRETALHLACALNDCWFVEQLLDNKADVNAIDTFGCTPLQICLNYPKPSTSILKKLLQHGATLPNKLFQLDNEVEKSLERMIKANAKNSSGVFPLYEAVYKSDDTAAMKFLTDGACPNSLRCYKRSLLQAACYNKSVACVKALLEAGVNVDESDLEGRTALHYAIIVESQEIVELLLQYRCDLNIRDSDGYTAFEMAALTNRWKVANQLLIVRQGVKCTEELLLEALERKCTEVVLLMLRQGNFKVHGTIFGQRLLQCAETTDQQKVVQYLGNIYVGECVGQDDNLAICNSEPKTTRAKVESKLPSCEYEIRRSREHASQKMNCNKAPAYTRKQPYIPRLHAKIPSTRRYKQVRFCPTLASCPESKWETEPEINLRGFQGQPANSYNVYSTDKKVLPLKHLQSTSQTVSLKNLLPRPDFGMTPEMQIFFKSHSQPSATDQSNGIDGSFYKYYCEKQSIYDDILGITRCHNETVRKMTLNVDTFFSFYKNFMTL